MKLKVSYELGGSEIFSLVSQGSYAITADENRYLHPVKVRELVSGAIWDFEVLDTGTGVRLGSHYNVRHGVDGEFLVFVLTNDRAHKNAPRGDAREVAPTLLRMLEKALDFYLWVDQHQHWIKTEDQPPPKDVLVLGDNGSEFFLVTFCGDYWRYSGFESKTGPLYWCSIPKRRTS